MANDTDQVKPKNPSRRIGDVEAAATLFLTGIAQVFTDPNEERIADTIRELRRAPGTVDSAVKLYESRADDSTFRWGIVYLASKVGAPGTAEWLRRVALEPLEDPKQTQQGFCESARDNEVLVRIMAIEGLAQVADSEGVEFVKDALTAVIANQADDALQSAAVVQFLRLDPDGATSSLRALLASRHKHLVDLEFRRSPVGVDERPRVLGLDAGESPLPPLRDKKGS